MNWIQLQGVLELSLIYSLVSIGVYLSFRVLQFPDLTVDGSFPLGAAVCASLILKGMSPWGAVLIAGTIGGMFGCVTAFLSSYIKMLNLLAGILTMSALYSINLRVMGNKPNLSLLGERTLFSSLEKCVPAGFPSTLCALFIGVSLLALGVIWFLRSEIGLAVRATGSNPRMARAQGVDDRKMITLGLAISNAFVALGGALFSQVYGFADVTLGVGTIIIGLASVIIGEAILPTRTVMQAVLACIVGTILYRTMIALALSLGDLGLQASDLNLLTSILVAFAMSFPKLKDLFKKGKV